MSAPPGPEETTRFYTLAAFFRARLGAAARKVPLDAGFSCPNRDGTFSRSGCLFCNPAGSGTGLLAQGLSLTEQWAFLAPRLSARHPEARLLAYLQSYSNTHASTARLGQVLAEISALPGVAGLCLGTRPDCLDVGLDAGGHCARLDLLASFLRSDAQASCTRVDVQAPRRDDAQASLVRNAAQTGAGFDFVQLDLGLQSADDAVLARIGRGHDAACFARAAVAAAARGLSVCAHLVHGLPGARPDDLAASVEFLNGLPVDGVKFHNLLVCRGAGLEALWRAGGYAPPGRERYVADLAQALAVLRPDICVQRLVADAAPGELLAPDWAADKEGTLRLLRAELARLGLSQGCLA